MVASRWEVLRLCCFFFLFFLPKEEEEVWEGLGGEKGGRERGSINYAWSWCSFLETKNAVNWSVWRLSLGLGRPRLGLGLGGLEFVFVFMFMFMFMLVFVGLGMPRWIGGEGAVR